MNRPILNIYWLNGDGLDQLGRRVRNQANKPFGGLRLCLLNRGFVNFFCITGGGNFFFILCMSLREELWNSFHSVSVLREEQYFPFCVCSAEGGECTIYMICPLHTGDLYQLPPVGERADLCFQAAVWPHLDLEVVELTRVFRQQDPVFAGWLSEIRIARPSADAIRALRERVGVKISVVFIDINILMHTVFRSPKTPFSPPVYGQPPFLFCIVFDFSFVCVYVIVLFVLF